MAGIDPRDLQPFTTAPEEQSVEPTDVVLIDRGGVIKYATVEKLSEDFPTPPSFAVAHNQTTADGATVSFALPVVTTDDDTIFVFDDGVLTRAWTLDSDFSGVTLDAAPTANSLIDIYVVGVSAVNLILASARLRIFGSSGNVTIDISDEANWTSFRMPNSSTGPRTVTFTGVAPEGLAFWVSNLSPEFPVTLSQTGPLATLAASNLIIAPNRAVRLVAFEGGLVAEGVTWLRHSSWPIPAVQNLGSIAGDFIVDIRLGHIIQGELIANANLVDFSNVFQGDKMEFHLEMNGFNLTLPGNVRYPEPDTAQPDLGSGEVWFELVRMTEDTAGPGFKFFLKGRDYG